jgi:hypothetical protein
VNQRAPVLGGLTAGAGTSTLAAALHARDVGRVDGREPAWLDALVCRPDPRSLREALALGARCPLPRPVLAVTGGQRSPDRLALRALNAQFRAVVLLPEVERWRGRDALAEAAAVLAEPDGALAEPLPDYAAALRQLVAAVRDGGGLARTTRPPLVAVPRAALRPLLPPGPAPGEQDEPDDEMLEAELDQAG